HSASHRGEKQLTDPGLRPILSRCARMARNPKLRYRKLGLHTWSDANFRGLSGQAPSAQTLYLYLLLGPHTTSLPALSQGGEAARAGSRGWSLEDFRRGWAEIESRAMARADWKARVVWVRGSGWGGGGFGSSP